MKKFFLCVMMLIMSANISRAAETGLYENIFQFMGEDRSAWVYVPEEYDESVQYDMWICLHGLGDNAADFSDVLINSAGWPTAFPNTIFIFPDGGSDPNRDYYDPQGDEAFWIPV